MQKFFFQVIDRTSPEPAEVAHEFSSLDDAKREAKLALAQMACDGLPEAPLNMISVELFDEDRAPIAEFRLLLEEISKTPPPTPPVGQ
ncbi:DUF6894 family protein [Rhizobium mesosinicum]|uniref:DUF6894 domain-containing protein n=1 Tax=Rhizobium mesosinicum TaxID=335017 RepID=A0ABS7GXF1_9HYPH|nr:hypothetical protein [Rhizobium mesosinicum]MBW9054591.1 hypothetical protein [Rhizobium mesosinicum]